MKVLVVDDDSISRKAMVHLLGSFDGLRCAQAEDGEDAWAQLQTGLLPLLVCCDVRMPRLSGLDLLQRLRAHAPTREIPFILVSSANDMDTVRAAAQWGAGGFIVKPLNHQDARPRLAKVLEAAQAKAMEAPAATQRRLNLSPERHQAYLRALRGQLAQVFDGDPVSADPVQRRTRLEALKVGLSTLGLWRGAGLLAQLTAAAEADDTLLAEAWAELQQQIALQQHATA